METILEPATCPTCKNEKATKMVRGGLQVGWCECGVVWLMEDIVASVTMSEDFLPDKKTK